jgi:hypothetical protein
MNDVGSPSQSGCEHDPEALKRFLQDLQRYLAEVREYPVPASVDRPASLARLQPLRVTFLDSLADLGYPTDSTLLRAFIAARYDRAVPSSQFGTIAVQERKSFDRRGPAGRPVWLGNGITFDELRPVKRIWGRSDWPVQWRIITPHSERVQRLHATAALCHLAVRDEFGASPTPIQQLALELAAELPGVEVDRLHPEFDAYGKVARKLTAEVEPKDRHLQELGALRLNEMPERMQLFGLEASTSAK